MVASILMPDVAARTATARFGHHAGEGAITATRQAGAVCRRAPAAVALPCYKWGALSDVLEASAACRDAHPKHARSALNIAQQTAVARLRELRGYQGGDGEGLRL